jgi:hypothetical protein
MSFRWRSRRSNAEKVEHVRLAGPRGLRWLVGLGVAYGVLALPFAALAKTVGVSAGRHSWVVTINGKAHRVAAEGTLHYCSSETVESLAPLVTMVATKGGNHGYTEQLFGPAVAGKTPSTEIGFSGRGSKSAKVEFPAIAFTGLSAHANVPQFVPGTYSVRVELTPHGGGQLVQYPKQILVESVRLAEAKCG